MLFKEKKPNEYTRGRGRGGHTKTDTRQRPEQAAPRQGPGWGVGGAEGQPGGAGRKPWAQGPGETGLGQLHGKASMAPHRDRTGQQGAQGLEQSRHQLAYEFKLELGPLNADPFHLQHMGTSPYGLSPPTARLTCGRASGVRA